MSMKLWSNVVRPLTFVIDARWLHGAAVHIEIQMAGWLDFPKHASIRVNNINEIGIATIQFPCQTR